MITIGKKEIDRFLRLAGTQLSGDWVLIGGTVLLSLGKGFRVTADIDIVAVDESEHVQMLQVMKIAEQLKLPVETINQAGSFFLRKIPDFKKHLVELHKGKTARIFRPDLFLFVSLKINRLTETDLNDCLTFIDFAKDNKELKNIGKLEQKIKTSLAKKDHRSEKLQALLKHLQLSRKI